MDKVYELTECRKSVNKNKDFDQVYVVFDKDEHKKQELLECKRLTQKNRMVFRVVCKLLFFSRYIK